MASLQQLLFWVFSVAMLAAGMLAITRSNLVNAAMLLIQVFLCMGGIFLLLHAFFLATVQVLVYAGAVVVLFLFVIMLLSPADEPRAVFGLPGIGALVTFALLAGAGAAAAIAAGHDAPQAAVEGAALAGTTPIAGGGLTDIMRALFTRYLLAFELTALILLVAMVGVVVLSKRESAERS
jgi:NADH-quinone oxidoreductase subunit J